jgi:nicotinamide-nucleotide amidase
MDEPAAPTPPGREILVAELLAIGTELTVGETTDTNSGELARSLVAHGVTVNRATSLPDHLATVAEAIRAALARADLVITTGGLGPTPDDLTREAVAEVCGEPLDVDPHTLAWLQGLWARRGLDFPESNRKQAWLIPSATSLENRHGTAPGWWVDRPDGRVIVLLPGPPREMGPMWHNVVVPRLRARGVGDDTDVRTLRLTGIGESHVVDRLGEPILRRTNPIVATYARHDAVDVRISARAADGASASDLAAAAEAEVMAALGAHVWARGDTTWPAAIGQALDRDHWTLSLAERGSEGALVALLRGLKALRHAEVDAVDPAAGEPADEGERELREAERVRAAAATDVGMVVTVQEVGRDTTVVVGIVTPAGRHAERRVAFMGGRQGADRAATAAAAVLLSFVRSLADR